MEAIKAGRTINKIEMQKDGEGFEKAEIYNIAGQKVMESSNAQIDVKALQAGVYMLKVFGNGSNEILRVVVK